MNTFQLPNGPVTGPRFLYVSWLSFVGQGGKSCFQTHTINQIIATAVKNRPLKQNLQYASMLQVGTFA